MKNQINLLLISIILSCGTSTGDNTDIVNEKQNLEIMGENRNSTTDSIIIQEKKDFLTGRYDPKLHPEFDFLDNIYHTKPEM